VRELLARELPGTRAEAIRVEGPLRSGQYSRIYAAEVPGIDVRVAVKCLVDPATGRADAASARRQFEALDRVNRAMASDARMRVPRPYVLAEDEGVIAVEWIAGRPMTEVLMSPQCSLAQARALMRGAALWLRAFTQAHHAGVRPLDVNAKLDALELVEDDLGGEEAAMAACAALRRHAVDAGTVPLLHSWLHGDFKTDNLMVAGDDVVGIDVHIRDVNAVTHDLAAFVNHWQLMVCHPRAWRWRPWREELARLFLATFDPACLAGQHLPFRWTALHVMLGNWTEFRRRMRPGPRHAYVRRCFIHEVRSMIRALDTEAGRHASGMTH
jgi:tRNA A-37 threonylcarbamoyl transferase component Bud32